MTIKLEFINSLGDRRKVALEVLQKHILLALNPPLHQKVNQLKEMIDGLELTLVNRENPQGRAGNVRRLRENNEPFSVLVTLPSRCTRNLPNSRF